MIVTLMKKNQISGITLPQKVNGRYLISDFGTDGKIRNIISVEGVDGKWILKETKKAKIERQDAEEIVAKPNVFYKVNIEWENEEAYIFVEEANDTRKIYKKLVVEDGTEISIGRAKSNTICVNNSFISSVHARLMYINKEWTIVDENSTNSTYVNDKRVNSAKLLPGDIIFIMGFKVVIGSNFIAINNPDDTVTYNTNVLYYFAPFEADETKTVEENETEEEYFYRSPRFKREITTVDIKIDPPPAPEKMDTIPLAMLIGPSVTMGMASFFSATFTVMNAMKKGDGIINIAPTIVMSLSMIIGMILWPILTKKYEKKQKAKSERIRQAKYKDYLFSIKDMILKEIKNQSDILYENNVSVEECAKRALYKKTNLWERVIGQDDFLKVRAGIGDILLDAKISYPEKKFSLENDNLTDELYVLANEPKKLENVPITYSFLENAITGIVGENKKQRYEFVKNIITRLMTLHSYDELKTVFIVGDEEEAYMREFRWIPHTWNEDKDMRYFATDLNEAKTISVALEKVFYERSDERYKADVVSPHYIIFNMNKSICEKTDIFNMVLRSDGSQGFSLVNVADGLKYLPKECSSVIEINEKKSKIYDRNDLSGKFTEFVPDIDLNYDVSALTKAMANIQLDDKNLSYSLPNMLTFLDMFNVDKIEHLNPLMRWKENNPTRSLAAQIGVDTLGEPFTLDLHEKFQGPHGLVAGMTGSGKSEFIITYILSMAVNYHPDEVAFILIDYKGGGLTGAFEDDEKGIKLPHLAGTITNLDGAAVKRSLISIQSELRRRQAIFNEARKISNEGTMDIYKYQKLYRDKVVSEPVPHLFIISDEFAELKSQQPEFMAQLISAARIGRSLGVHLILATQKPSGVVDDQIWSNTRFRVCLKVSEKADSMDMIKRPEAAELSNTGRFYLQVGFNELFALGQSAWCGAPYNENKDENNRPVTGIKVIDNIGRVVKEVKPKDKKKNNGTTQKQIVAMVKYLSDLAKEENISVRKLWLDPIPADIYSDELIRKYNVKDSEKHILEAVVGEYDDPFNQSQNVLKLNISEEGNTLIYGVAGSGKLTFITTVIYELLRVHTAEYLNMYILDFGAETLKVFEKAPQVGDVVLSTETEKVVNLMKMLKEEISERKKLFAEYGGDYMSYISNSKCPCPNIVVIINNYSAFAEMYEMCEELLAIITREGTKYGISFIVTATNTGSMRFRLVQNFKRIIVQQMNDKGDYATLIGQTEGTYPSEIKGRGLIKNEHTYEFQTAKVSKDIKEFVNELAQNEKSVYARKIPTLPKKMDSRYFENHNIMLEEFPVGINKKNLKYIRHNFAQSYITLVLAQNMEQCTITLAGIAEIMSERTDTDIKVIDALSSFETDDSVKYQYVNGNYEEAVVEMFNDMVSRHKFFKFNERTEAHKVIYIINGFDALKQKLSEDGKDKLNVLLENGRLPLNVHFVICDSLSAINRVTYDAWYKKHCENVSGIWVGDGASDQYVLKINKTNRDLYQDMEDGFGVYIDKGRYTIMKLVTSRFEKTEEE